VRRRDERGAISIIVASLTVILIVVAAFTVDFGMAYLTKRQLSTAADAAALAADAVYKTEYKGVCTVPGNDPETPVAANANVRSHAESAADSLFLENYPQGTAADGTITDVRCKGTGVEVVYSATGDSDSPFGVLAGGTGTITTQGNAAAAFSVGGGICALCVLLNVDTNNTDFSVDGGDIYVNGNVSTGPNSNWTATTSITIGSGSIGGVASPPAKFGPPIPDPFASLVLPLPTTGMTNLTNPCTQGPGIYGNASIGNCTLQAGAYVITGKWSMGNKSKLLGNGVTLYFGDTGWLDFKNGGEFDGVVAPTSPPRAGWPSGFAIIYGRNNPNDLELQGNGHNQVGGNVYVPNGKITFNGNSCFVADGGAIVAKNVSSVGNKSCLKVTNAKNAGQGTAGNLRLTE
jgi:predicted outer membrane repeat protein